MTGLDRTNRAAVAGCTRAASVDPPFTDVHGAGAGGVSRSDLLPAQLLDGDEIVIFAVKPSLWFVLFTSARWLIAMGLVIVVVGWLGGVLGVDKALAVKAALAVAGARLGFALLQWVSRLYVLTNRRIMRLRGIFNVDLFECQLAKIQNTYLTLAWYERVTGLGSISFATAGTGGIEATWANVNNPLELHERVRSAIQRAQRPGNSV
ncbi:MAG: PH domain-containing protein [Planctomycetes bacterium]|nr:PH domain-containing protein [Planctomycetota bacterium]